jgi:hypothetical protein
MLAYCGRPSSASPTLQLAAGARCSSSRRRPADMIPLEQQINRIAGLGGADVTILQS